MSPPPHPRQAAAQFAHQLLELARCAAVKSGVSFKGHELFRGNGQQRTRTAVAFGKF
jgi:hypothetical protein